MTERLMKDSGIEWVGNIPTDWNKSKVNFLCDQIFAGGTPDTTKPYFWDGEIPWIPSGSCKDKEILSFDRTITKIGCLCSSTKNIPAYTTLIAMTGATCANVGYTTFDTCANQSVTAFITNNKVISKFLFYSLIAAKKDVLSKQMGGAQAGINVQDCKNIRIAFPNTSKQQKIAEYLDSKCSEIDSLTKDIQSQIDILEEYKKSVITEAVTKGLDSDVEIKDSGIENYTVPKKWKRIQLKFTTDILRGGSPRPIEQYMSNDDTGYNWIKIGDTTKGYKYIDNTKCKLVPSGLSKTRLIAKGSLIMSNSMSFGQPYILNIDGCIHDGWVAFSNLKNVDKNYLFYCLSSEYCLIQFKKAADGGVVQNLNIDKVGETTLYLPKSEQQQEIADYLDSKCSKIDSIITEKKKQLEILLEYKKSLIYEYITGKKEVV